MPSKAVREVYRVLIEAVYRRWNVEKIGDVPQIMEKYKGQEDDIYDKVVRKYVFCHKENVWRPLIEAMYRRFNKSKLQELPQILSKYKKSEAALYRALCDKYIPGVRKGDPPPDVDVWPEVSESVSPVSAKSAEPDSDAQVAIASPVSAKSADPETENQVAEEVTAEPPANAEPEAEPASAPTASSATAVERPAETLESEYPVVESADQADLALTSVKEEEQEKVTAASTAPSAEPAEAPASAEPAAGPASEELASAQQEPVQSPGTSLSAATGPMAEEVPQSVESVARLHQRPRRREGETPAEREARRAARRLAKVQPVGISAGHPQAEATHGAQDTAGQQQFHENIDRNGLTELHHLPLAEAAAAGYRQRSRRRRAEAEGATQETLTGPLAQGIGAGDQVNIHGDAKPVEAAVETKLDREARRTARRASRAQQLAGTEQQPHQAGNEGQLAAEALQPDQNGKRTAPSELLQPRRKRRRVTVEGGAAPEGHKHRSRRRKAEALTTEQPATESLVQGSSAGDPLDMAERPLATRPKASRRPPQRPPMSPGGSPALVGTPPAAEQPAGATGPSIAQQTAPKSEWEKAWEARQGQAQAPPAASSSSAAVPGIGQGAAQGQSAEEAQAAMRRREAALREILHQKRLRAGSALVSVTPGQSPGEALHTAPEAQAQAAPQPTQGTLVHVRKSRRQHAKTEGSHRKANLAPPEPADPGADAVEAPKVTLRGAQEAAYRAKALKMFGIGK